MLAGLWVPQSQKRLLSDPSQKKFADACPRILHAAFFLKIVKSRVCFKFAFHSMRFFLHTKSWADAQGVNLLTGPILLCQAWGRGW